MLAFLLASGASSPAWAGQSPEPAGGGQSTPTADFLFGRPRVTLGVRGSFVFARAGSDLFDFVTRQLTIDDGGFNAPAFATDLGIPITDRVDALVGFEMGRKGTASEYRDFVDNNNLPIEQSTSLTQTMVTGSVRVALTPRGRSVSRLAWIPSTFTPYAGAGAGIMWWEFKQSGDFVDYVDLRVFSDVFQSDGATPTAHVFGGMDMQVYRRLFLAVEGRYVWAAGQLGTDFIDFDPIDLAGFRVSAGINLLF